MAKQSGEAIKPARQPQMLDLSMDEWSRAWDEMGELLRTTGGPGVRARRCRIHYWIPLCCYSTNWERTLHRTPPWWRWPINSG